MRRFPKPLQRLFSLGAALALVGCGGGGGGGSSGTTLVTFTTFQPAAVVIGQANFTGNAANQGGAAGGNTLRSPGAPCQVGARFYIPDFDNHRILGFNTVPTVADAAADFVGGQPDLLSVSSNAGGGGVPGAGTLFGPWAVCAAGGNFFVSDQGNHRVLIFNGVPTATGAAASFCVGQPDLVTRLVGAGQVGLRDPSGIHAVGTKLIVCDLFNHRVMIWNTIPTTNGANADLVLGQTNFAGTSSNQGNLAPAAGTLSAPFGVWSDGTRLVVADGGNHRVLIWNSFPTTNGQAADIVLGQGSFTTKVPALTAVGMNTPTDVTSDGTRLIVGDCENNRILIFDAFPVASVTAATTVLGQGDFTHGTGNDDDQNSLNDGLPTARTMNTTGGYAFVKIFGQRLYSGDHKNHRCLIYEGQ